MVHHAQNSEYLCEGMNTSFNLSSHSRNGVINEVNICETNYR